MNDKRLKDTFLRLLETDSPFGHEKAAAEIVTAFLDRHGIPWEDDGSAARTGSDTGNIISAGPGGARLSFCAHMDTIRIFEKKSALTDGSVIKSSGVLGIDDKSGVALLLELMALLNEKGGVPPDIHFLFTVGEEWGFRGAWALDPRHFTGAYNFVVDSGGVPLARAVTGGVGQTSYSIGVKGAMAHASIRGGKNAAVFAAECIAALEPGPAGASAFIHVASLECPGSPNTVPDRALIQGQLLYRDSAEEEPLLEKMRAAVRERADRAGFELVFSAARDCAPWFLPDDDPLIEYARLAAAKAGLPFHTGQTGSGSDAQVIAQRGGRAIKISTGMLAPHSAEERVDFQDMKKSLRFLWALAGREPAEI
ncbi:MAG: M20/M25/M40 family metallo-hydrolase [Treponema sp.]|jgi:tripeptide aminopeptidase|nr:M20/M25/M40 family metallo-hydrolase [Treponema sp.]